MRVNDAAVQRILLDKKLLTKDQIESAILLSPSIGKSFVDTLVFKNYVSEDILGQAIAEAFGVPYVALKGRTIPAEMLELVSEESAVSYEILPFAKDENGLHLAMGDPTNYEVINFIEKKTGLVVKPYFAFHDQIAAGLSQYKNDISAAIQKILNRVDAIGTDLTKVAEEVPTIKMLDTLMDYAVAKDASDIHMEGQEKSGLIRFRLDGILHDVLVLDPKVLPALVARIKYLSNLKIDEHRLPQDGRFKYEHLGSRVAIRVSIIPTFHGENVVLRLLPETSRTRTLDELGFAPANIRHLTDEMKRTNGIILLTGPTGSGKTTTLYSLLDMVNKPEVKITTIEDPVEYSVPRISQTQVNTQTGMDFAAGLRALLRHDPNIIMVGEIRDKETATISINAALTGHLVLSTLHTNDSTSSIPRLIDLGVEPFLVAATVRVIVAQRLVRQLCPKCAKPTQLPGETLKELAETAHFSLDELKTKTFYQAVGCPECANGFRGRIGIHEVFVINEEVNALIINRPSNDEVRNLAMKNGMYSMVQDGIAKATAGLTTIEEVFREAGHGE